MIRPVLTEVGIFLIPFAVYALFLIATRSGVLASSSWPVHLIAKLALGSLLLDRGSPEKALAFLDRAVEVNPLNAASWYGIGSAYLKTGKMAEALEAAKRAVVLNEEEPRYQRLVAEIAEIKERRRK